LSYCNIRIEMSLTADIKTRTCTADKQI